MGNFVHRILGKAETVVVVPYELEAQKPVSLGQFRGKYGKLGAGWLSMD